MSASWSRFTRARTSACLASAAAAEKEGEVEVDVISFFAAAADRKGNASLASAATAIPTANGTRLSRAFSRVLAR